MSEAIWKQRTSSKDWFGEYRGLTIRVLVAPASGLPTEIRWFISGREVETAPVDCALAIAKYIGCAVIDREIAEDAAWAAAERRYNREQLLRR